MPMHMLHPTTGKFPRSIIYWEFPSRCAVKMVVVIAIALDICKSGTRYAPIHAVGWLVVTA